MEEGTAVKKAARDRDTVGFALLSHRQRDFRSHGTALQKSKGFDTVFLEIAREFLRFFFHSQQVGAIVTVTVQRRHDDIVFVREVFAKRLAVMPAAEAAVNQESGWLIGIA